MRSFRAPPIVHLLRQDFCERSGHQKSDIIAVDQLYHAPSDVFYEVIEHLNDDIHTAAIFAHNPGITDFVNELTSTRIDDMPTCGIFAVQIPIQTWKHFEKAEKALVFDAPKLG